MERKHYTIDEVRDYFKQFGYELLENIYTRNDIKLKYKCPNGHFSSINFHDFKDGGRRCKQCSKYPNYTIEDIREKFLERNCILLSQEYMDSQQPLDYICSCGAISKISWTSFRLGHMCPHCALKNRSEKRRHDYDYVYNYFKDNNCELLEKEYINAITKMKYRCQCGNISFIKFNQFQQGVRCNICSESHGERKITNYLIKNNIIFKKEYKFKDCKHIHSLPFDFAILDVNNHLQCLIEYDGEQHFKSIEWFNGKNGLEQTQLRDQIKNNYCKFNGIHLLRIPYWELDNVEYILDNFLSNFNEIKTKQAINY